MLSRLLRLRASSDIKKVIVGGKQFRNKFFSVKYLHSDDFKACIVISKKIQKHSSKRHRIKRIFSVAIFKALMTNKVSGNLVFFPNPLTITLKSTDLEGEILNIFNQITNE